MFLNCHYYLKEFWRFKSKDQGLIIRHLVSYQMPHTNGNAYNFYLLMMKTIQFYNVKAKNLASSLMYTSNYYSTQTDKTSKIIIFLKSQHFSFWIIFFRQSKKVTKFQSNVDRYLISKFAEIQNSVRIIYSDVRDLCFFKSRL